MNLYRYCRYPFVLCMIAALSPTGPGTMAADKKHSNKKSSSQVVKHGSNRSAPSANRGRSGGQSRHVAAARPSSGGSKKHVASVRHSSGGSSKKHVASSSHSRKPVQHAQRVASSSSRSAPRQHAAQRHVEKKAVPHTQLASISSGNRGDNRVAHHATHVARNDAHMRHNDNIRSSARSNDVHVNRNDLDRRSVARAESLRRSDPARYRADSVRYRDRSHYERRHEHHSSDWYRSNGWVYDRDYYDSYHAHRYCNDSLGIFVIESFGPSYYPGYDYSPYYNRPVYANGYSDYYGFDYETRLAVQEALAQAGYYNGPIDGVIGSGTRSAISSYQYAYGLPVSGRIDNPLLQSLRIL